MRAFHILRGLAVAGAVAITLGGCSLRGPAFSSSPSGGDASQQEPTAEPASASDELDELDELDGLDDLDGFDIEVANDAAKADGSRMVVYDAATGRQIAVLNDLASGLDGVELLSDGDLILDDGVLDELDPEYRFVIQARETVKAGQSEGDVGYFDAVVLTTYADSNVVSMRIPLLPLVGDREFAASFAPADVDALRTYAR